MWTQEHGERSGFLERFFSPRKFDGRPASSGSLPFIQPIVQTQSLAKCLSLLHVLWPLSCVSMTGSHLFFLLVSFETFSECPGRLIFSCISPGTSCCSLLSPCTSQARVLFASFWDAPSAPVHEKCDHTHWEITSLDSFPKRQISWVQWVDFQSYWPAQSMKTWATRCVKYRKRAQSQAGSQGSFPLADVEFYPYCLTAMHIFLPTPCWLHPLYKDRRTCPIRNWNAA